MDIFGFLSGLTLTDWGLIGGAITILLYVAGTWNHDHFSKRKLPYMKPVPFLGSSAPIFFFQKSFNDHLKHVYDSHKEDYFGMFDFGRPTVVLRDPELIKMVSVKDFDHFTDHNVVITDDIEPMFGKNLISLTGQKWRDMRAVLSPAFTSSKMKGMFAFISQCGQQVADYLEEEMKQQVNGKIYEIELKDLFTRFTNDVIATSAFGLNCDSLKNKSNRFYQMGKDLTNFQGLRSLIFLGYLLCPRLMKLFRIPILKPEVRNFFRSLVHDTVATREKEGIIRPDMLHLLMQAKKGELNAEVGEDEKSSVKHTTTKILLSDEDVTAQAVIFFFAGFETSSTLLSFATHLLAVHPDIQERLQEEVDSVLEEDAQVKYESIQGMKYLDMVLSETLRLYPPAALTDRVCVKNYAIPAKGNNPQYTIRKGEVVSIPIYGLHRDPEHFPEPEKFDPDRFSDENKQNIKPFTYMPFGAGPRICIGQRFALMEAKLAIVHLLSRFTFKVVEKTPVPMKIAKSSLNLTAEGGFWVGIERRKK